VYILWYTNSTVFDVVELLNELVSSRPACFANNFARMKISKRNIAKLLLAFFLKSMLIVAVVADLCSFDFDNSAPIVVTELDFENDFTLNDYSMEHPEEEEEKESFENGFNLGEYRKVKITYQYRLRFAEQFLPDTDEQVAPPFHPDLLCPPPEFTV
jgi:hypothetical protein